MAAIELEPDDWSCGWCGRRSLMPLYRGEVVMCSWCGTQVKRDYWLKHNAAIRAQRRLELLRADPRSPLSA